MSATVTFSVNVGGPDLARLFAALASVFSGPSAVTVTAPPAPRTSAPADTPAAPADAAPRGRGRPRKEAAPAAPAPEAGELDDVTADDFEDATDPTPAKITRADLNAKVTALIGLGPDGKAAWMRALKSTGATKLSEIPEAKWPAIWRACHDAMPIPL